MGEFFKPWWRKIGVVTLLMACTFMGLWIRSRHITDTLTFRIEESSTRQCLTTSQQGLKWTRRSGSGQYVVNPEFMNISWSSDDSQYAEDYRPLNDGWDIDWNWQYCGFQFGEYYLGSSSKLEHAADDMTPQLTLVFARLVLWNVPYWSIVIPLTPLSAFLLLSKPKKSTQKKNGEPI